MKTLLLLLIPAGLFWAAARFYARSIARELGEDPTRPTPAHVQTDGRDFVPTRRFVLFAHHFSAIAGAGPIVGPTVAILYGWGPAWIWIVLGGIFIGAVHDFTALFVSMREGGRSVADIARKTLGPWGFNVYILFTLAMLALVTSSFCNMAAMSLTSFWPLDKIGLAADQTLLQTEVKDGVTMARIGGIASMSVIIITLFSPILGWLNHRKHIHPLPAYVLAGAVCVASIVAGFYWPVALGTVHLGPIVLDPARLWMLVLSVYVLIAAGVPVWVILQPRDFINVQILYGGILLLFASLLSVGLRGVAVFQMDAFAIGQGTAPDGLGPLWPMMFITVACGAISGFHALVATGTTVKQLSREDDARKIAFESMLLESFLAVCALLTLAVGLKGEDYRAIVWPVAGKSNPILGFSLAAGHLFQMGLGIPAALGTVFGILLVEGFVITTLDAAVRLNRYLFEELWSMLFVRPPRFLMHHWFNAALSVVIMWVLADTAAFNYLWPLFGTANQMLAALTLLAVVAWLMLRGRRYVFALLPAIFMVVTTLWALWLLAAKFIRASVASYQLPASAPDRVAKLAGTSLLAALAVFLMVLAGATVLLAAWRLTRTPRTRQEGTSA